MKFTVIEKRGGHSDLYQQIEMHPLDAEDEQDAVAKAVERYMETNPNFVDLHHSITLMPVIRTIELLPLIKAAQKKMKDQESKS